MNTVKRIAKNTAFLVFGDLISKILSLLLIVFFARHLGDVVLGKYSFAFAFTGLFFIIADFGLTPLITREVARNKEKAAKFIANTAVMRLVLSILVFFLIVVSLRLIQYSPLTTKAVYLIAASRIFLNLSGVFRSIFKAFETMEYEFLIIITERIFTCSAGILVLFLGYGLIAVSWIIALGSFLSLLLSAFYVFRTFAKPKLELDFEFWKYASKESFPFLLSGIFFMIYYQIDTVMLSMMEGDAVVGWYSAAYRLVTPLGFIPGAFVASLFPVMSRYFVSSPESLKFAYEKAFKYLLILALPLAVGTTLLADKVIIAVYSYEFSNSIIALQILIWSEAIIFLNAVFGTVINSINKQKVNTYLTGINAVFNVVLNLLLIPTFSFVGASIATVATQLVGGTMAFCYLRKNFHSPGLISILWRSVFASLLMGGVVVLLRSLPIPVIVVLSGITYFLAIIVLKGIDKEDIIMIRSFMEK